MKKRQIQYKYGMNLTKVEKVYNVRLELTEEEVRLFLKDCNQKVVNNILEQVVPQGWNPFGVVEDA